MAMNKLGEAEERMWKENEKILSSMAVAIATRRDLKMRNLGIEHTQEGGMSLSPELQAWAPADILENVTFISPWNILCILCPQYI